jgi:hypothetical protein
LSNKQTVEQILKEEVPELDPVKAEQLVNELGFILDEYEATGKLVEYHPSLKFYEHHH